MFAETAARAVADDIAAKIPMLEEAFTGHFTDSHAFLLAKMLTRGGRIDADITDLDTRIEVEIHPLADHVERLDAIPGIDRTAAQAITAEIGEDRPVSSAPAQS